MGEPAKQTHPLAPLTGVLGAVGGWMFAQYTGASGWLPIGAAILLLMVFNRTPLKPRWFAGAICVTLAQIIWFVAAGAAGGLWTAVIGDIAILLILTVLLWLRPGLLAASLLGLMEIGSLAYNAWLIARTPFGDPVHKALTAHIVVRLIAILALAAGYRNYRRGVVPIEPEQSPGSR